MPGTQIRFETHGKRRFLHPLVYLEEMRMPGANADPDNFQRAVCRKSSRAGNRQNKRPKLNRAQFLAQRRIDILRHLAKKAERQVHLPRIDPSDALNVWIETGEGLLNIAGRIDGDEKAFAHKEPGLESLP